jgi:opacity protein-like surface antigen
MLHMKFLVITVMFLLLAVSAYAADVDGKWSGSVSGPQGEFPVAFTFKADGANLTGSTMGFDGAEVPIKDGKIDGNIITFTVTFDFGGMPFVLSYKGIVSPEEIKMSGDAAGMPFEFVLKKAK